MSVPTEPHAQGRHPESALPARDRLAAVLSKPGTFIAVAAVTFVLSWFGAVAYLSGICVALLTLWARRWDWPFFGITRARWGAEVLRAVKYTIVIIVVVDVVMQPLVDRALGATPDLSPFEPLRGNLKNLVTFFFIMWVVAAFGEELFFRGYLMRGWARLFGDTDRSWLLGAVLSTLVFGLAHLYQGVSGVVNTALVGFMLALQFYRGRTRLVSCMLTHGVYDMVGLTLVYLGKPDALGKLLF